MFGGVRLPGFLRVVLGMQMVAMRRMGALGGLGVIALAVLLRRVAMVLRGHLVMIRSLLVVVCDVVGVCHGAVRSLATDQLSARRL